MSNLLLPLTISTLAAFALALLSAVAGFGGGALLLPVFTSLFGIRQRSRRLPSRSSPATPAVSGSIDATCNGA
jgi:uncharacterized membrane protein YfcA